VKERGHFGGILRTGTVIDWGALKRAQSMLPLRKHAQKHRALEHTKNKLHEEASSTKEKWVQNTGRDIKKKKKKGEE